MGQSIVAVLDLGTSKSIALVAQKDHGGKLSVLRAETLPSKGAIRRGRIYNSEETAGIISSLIRKLNTGRRDPIQIEKIYVGVGGQSLHTQIFTIKRIVSEEMVTPHMIDSMENEAGSYTPDLEDNLGVVSCEYYADGHLVENPKGTMASVIEARFQLLVGNPCLKRNLTTVFNNKDISVVYFISPLATAEAVLTPEEKESGCALVELGEGITYVSIYKNKALKYLATLPVGGLAITKDIRSLNVSEAEAEVLKIEHGSVITDLNNSATISLGEGQNPSRSIEQKELNWIIEARADEIVKNVWAQIQVSGYSQSLDAGIVITGGGALLRDLPQYIKTQTGKEVRLADAKAWVNSMETALSPADSCVIGLALLGKENCVKVKVVVPPPPKIDEPALFNEEEIEVVKQPERQPTERPEKGSFLGSIGKKLKKTIDNGTRIFQEEELDNKNNETNKR